MKENTNTVKKWTWNWNSLSVYRSELMGIAIIIIMLFHSRDVDLIKNDKIIGNSILYRLILDGNSGVDIFLFLSGMGLFFAWHKRKSLFAYYKKRILRILPTYFIISGIYWYFRMIKVETFHTQAEWVQKWFCNVSCYTWIEDNDRTYWYIPFLIILYLVSPIVITLFSQGRLIRYTTLIIILLGSFYALDALMGTEYYDIYEIAIGRIPSFVFGCFIGSWVKEKRPMNKKWGFIILAGLLVRIISKEIIAADESLVMVQRIDDFWVGMAICMCGCFLISSLESEKVNSVLRWFGSKSLELYLLHIGYRNLVFTYYQEDLEKNVWQSIMIYLLMLAVTCFTAAVIGWIKKLCKNGYRS